MAQELTDPDISFKSIFALEGGRYSPNLRRWLKYQKRSRVELPQVYRSTSGNFPGSKHIGWLYEDDSWFHGSRLQEVLAKGGRASSWAFPPSRWDIVPDFWRDYARVGRCAIDTRHSMYFIGDQARWKVSGDTRKCLWCGACTQHLHRWEETVQHKEWRND